MEKKYYRADIKNQINYFMVNFLLGILGFTILHRGIVMDIFGEKSAYFLILYVGTSLGIGLFRTYKISYNLEVQGTNFKLIHSFTGEEILNIDTGGYFVHGNMNKGLGIRKFQFQKINTDEKVLSVNCFIPCNTREFTEVIEGLYRARRLELKEQLGLDKSKTYEIRNDVRNKITNTYALASSLILPGLIVAINMLARNKIPFKAMVIIIELILTIFILKGLLDNRKRNKATIREIRVNKSSLRIKTLDSDNRFDWKDIDEIIITHPAVSNLGPKLIKLVAQEKQYIYSMGDSKSPRADYGKLFGLIDLFNKNRIGIFY